MGKYDLDLIYDEELRKFWDMVTDDSNLKLFIRFTFKKPHVYSGTSFIMDDEPVKAKRKIIKEVTLKKDSKNKLF